MLDDNIVGEFLKINGREYVMSKRGPIVSAPRRTPLVKVAEMKRVRLSDLPKSKAAR